MKKILAYILSAFALLNNSSLSHAEDKSKLVVSICTKGEFRPPANVAGFRALAEVAHKHGVPVTWMIKPFTAKAMLEELKEWNSKYGDEVAWFSEGTPLNKAAEELKELRELITWQPIVSTGNTKYGKAWVELYEKNGIEAIWGRCYEQTDADHISDRGCPHGFYYLNPINYKVPNPVPGGVVTVPWLSNDPNLVFWSGFQSSFTFDPDDPMTLGIISENNSEYWHSLVKQYVNQTRYNPFVPLIVQQEYASPTLKQTLKPLDRLFEYMKAEGISVVPLAESIRRYKKAYPVETSPTYAVYDSLKDSPGVKEAVESPLTNLKFQVQKEPLKTAFQGAPFNGYYTTDLVKIPDQNRFKLRTYYHPEGTPFYDHGKLFVYYDKNGLLCFDENKSDPIRITSYFEIPEEKTGFHTLPEMSHFFMTDDLIPKSTISEKMEGKNKVINIKVPGFTPNIVAHEKLAYGVMLWGDYNSWNLPENAPKGTKVISKTGLFVPIVLNSQKTEEVNLTLIPTDQ